VSPAARPPLYIFHTRLHHFSMKLFLIAIIGVLLWQSTDARQFTADTLQSMSEIIEPNENKKLTIGETIDSFLN